MPSDRTKLRLRDIMEDADQIADFIDGMGADDFRADQRTLYAVERLLQRVTEAAVQIEPDDAAALGADLPIAAMRALGNRLRHEYRDIDPGVIFDIARIQVPLARAAAERALENR